MIRRLFHCSLSFEELMLEDFFILLNPLYVRVGCWGGGIGGGGEQGHAGMEPIIGEERGQSSGRMSRIVVAQFCHVDEACPIYLLVVAVDPKVLLQYGIHPLRVAICLGMKGCRAVGLDLQKFD